MAETATLSTARLARAMRALLPRSSDYASIRQTWQQDLLAGVTVGIVALPLALAFGVSSGVGAAAGLVTAVIAGFVAAVFGGSHVQVSGPTGAMVVVLAPIVAAHGVGMVAILCILAGALLIVVGATRLGRAVAYLPWPVVEGFTVGIGIIIFLQQVPLAVSAPARHGENTALAAFDSIRAAPWPQALTSLAVVGLVAALMLVLPRLHRAVPASLIAIITATLAVELVGADVPRLGALPESLPAPQLSVSDLSALPSLTGAVIAIAALAGIESLLSARVAAGLTGRHRQHHRSV